MPSWLFIEIRKVEHTDAHSSHRVEILEYSLCVKWLYHDHCWINLFILRDRGVVQFES